MTARRIVAALLVLAMTLTAQGFARKAGAQPATPPPAPGGAQAAEQSPEATPARVSYIHGEVSFWRPGAEDWAPAQLNTPLAPGDILYTGPGGTVEIQVGARAFVRAGHGAQIGLDNQEPDFIQFHLTSGHAGIDLRQLAAGSTVELDTPNAAFTVERSGYYHVDVDLDITTFRTHRGGSATMTPAGGTATAVPANQQVVLTGTDSPGVAVGAAPQLTAWDQWNYQRTDYLTQTASARYVSPAVYGTEALDQHGTWRTVETYGTVWVPTGVAAGWAPYTRGRWILDPRFGWTWLDDAPWGWAPYHYGRWVLAGSYWAWAPGPIVVRPAYAPALVVFLGGATVSVGRPLGWAPLGWGEPVIPWWGRRSFVGVPWWGGWGGPRVVNNVVISRSTTVHATNITVYKNVHVTNAVVGVPADRFGHGRVEVTRISHADVRQLKPVHGALDAKPVPASVMPSSGPAVKPAPGTRTHAVVATRPPHDPAPALREHGLPAGPAAAPATAPRLVPPPRAAKAPTVEPRPRPGTPPQTAPGMTSPASRKPEDKKGEAPERVAPAPPPGAATKGPRPPRADTAPERGPAPRKPEDKKAETPERVVPAPPGAATTGPRPPRAATVPERGRDQAVGRPSPAPLPPGAPKMTPPSPANVPTATPASPPKMTSPRPPNVPGPPPANPPKVMQPGATGRIEPPAGHAAPPRAPAEQQRRMEPPPRAGQPERGEPPARSERPERGDRQERGDRR